MLGCKVLSIFCIIFTLVECGKVCEKDVVIQTTAGIVKGCFTSERTIGMKKPLYWFRSIPFAEPPVGNLRFEAPQAKKSWKGVIDVSEPMPVCIQDSNPVRGSEDCLYLKVYTTMKPSTRNNLPVMVWIYGGAFTSGSTDFSDHAPDHLLDQDVIVVSFHYRIGIMGFLSTGDGVAPGNSGLKDQILALKWIKENIRSFGGDPDRITIFGQSAGAAAISYLLQTNQTQGLFQRAIIQSGSSLSPWGLSKSTPDFIRSIARTLNVPTSSSEAILQGLKSIDVELLQTTSNSQMTRQLISSNPLSGLVYGPVLEPDHPGAVITGRSHEKLANGQFHNVPIMVGYTSMETMIDSITAIMRVWLARYDLNPTLLVPQDMNARATARAIIASSIKSRYFGLIPILTSFTNIMRFTSDDQFERPIQEAIRLYSAKTGVYFYRFSYQGGLFGVTNRTIDGVGHTEDVGYIFHLNWNGTAEDLRTRSKVVKLWTNFAKFGNPTPQQDVLLDNVIWTPNVPNQQGDLKCLDINKKLTNVVGPNKDNIAYWASLYSRYGRPPFDTY